MQLRLNVAGVKMIVLLVFGKRLVVVGKAWLCVPWSVG